MLIVFSRDQLIEVVKQLAEERITAKQKKILCYIAYSQQHIPITPLVHKLVAYLSCSETAVWNNINQLKRIGIISYGDAQSKGRPVVLGSIGKMLARQLNKKGEKK